MNGPSKCSGTVQSFHEGQWKSVCDYWGVIDMQVACKELGCWDGSGQVVAVPHYFSGLVGEQKFMPNCIGGEKSLLECNPDFRSTCNPAGVMCAGKALFHKIDNM